MSKSHVYYLVLTKSERDAIDFVGYRYSHGSELYRLLLNATWRIAEAGTPSASVDTGNIIEGYKVSESDDVEWDGDYDIMFFIEEVLSWEIKELIIKINKCLALFSESLQCKLLEFCGRIV